MPGNRLRIRPIEDSHRGVGSIVTHASDVGRRVAVRAPHLETWIGAWLDIRLYRVHPESIADSVRS